MLFNNYMSKLPLSTKSKHHLLRWATFHPQVEKLRDITPYLNTWQNWLKSRKIKLSAKKLSATVFKTWSNEAKFDPPLTINNSPIPVKSEVKVLVVTIDRVLNFGEHKNSPKRKYKRAITYWKILVVATGAAQETLSVTYKAIGRSVLNYGAPIWISTISNTNCNHLQTQQNIALRTITVCVNMSDINDLRNEGEMLPVKANTEILAEQLPAGSYESNRADHETTSLTSLHPMRRH